MSLLPSFDAKPSITLKVDVEKVDSIMELCGELVVIKSQLEQYVHELDKTPNPRLDAIMGLFDKTLRDVFEKAMSMRMVSLKSTLLKLERSLRDAALRLGKEIRFIAEGEEIELDRTVVEQISDPLMHLCRNAVDHGIESNAARRSAGKSSEGCVKIKAYYEGARAVIEITDDGRGIDRERVITKAKEKGLLPPSNSESSLSDQDVYGFLFAPGFSTAETVTDISGRGVGLDVVRSTIRQLKGDVSVTTTVGKSTTFKVSIPLSTSMSEGIIVAAGRESYVLPLAAITEFVSVTDRDIEEIRPPEKVMRLRDQYIPVLKLAELFHLPTSQKNGVALVTMASDGPIAIVVDQVMGQSQIIMKKVDDSVSGSALVAGAAVMGDGRVLLVLDPSLISIKQTGGVNATTG